MVSLRLVPVSGHPIEVTGDQSLVGRDPSCEIVVAEGSVSRRHARLERRAGAWWVVDQGSANGTYVNSLKVAETALKNGEELRFGALAFRVEIAEDPDATVASPIVSDETLMATPPAGVTPVPTAAAPPDATPRPVVPPPTPSPAAPPPIPQPASAAAPPPPPSGAASRVRPASPSPVPQMSGGRPPAKKGRGPLFWIAIGCCGCLLAALLIAGLLGGSVFVMTKGATDAVQAHLELVRQGEIEAAYADLSLEMRTALSLQDYERLLAGHDALRENADATFFSRSVENDQAVLRGVLTTATGQSEPVTVELVKRGGAWKITAIRFEPDED